MTATITVHGVLAGAYRGKRTNLAALLTHASADGGETALCGRVAEGSLCDVVEPGPPTCKRCAPRWTPVSRGGVRDGSGQPPVRGVKQTERLTLRLTEAELAEILDAVPDGVAVSWWIIEAALIRARLEAPHIAAPEQKGTE